MRIQPLLKHEYAITVGIFVQSSVFVTNDLYPKLLKATGQTSVSIGLSLEFLASITRAINLKYFGV